jgi:UDP-N-acetylglucosamine/UDP-N-acetylgalactosamine 4-epimerase
MESKLTEAPIPLRYAYTGGLWLVTGAAGFIGSNLIETLLADGQHVRALDNLATGFRENIEAVKNAVGQQKASLLEFIEGDVRDPKTCDAVMDGVAHVSHQAGLGSVPRSLSDPLTTNEVNVTGFLNVLDAARRNAVKSFVYAASSSTYGNEPNLPKIENRIGEPLSPYAVTKLINEIYARNYMRCYDFRATGLRYFNVFGPRQDPNGAYAAVIPKWTSAMIENRTVTIHGDGLTSRDFCFVANAVEANIRASLAAKEAQGEVYNVALGHRTTLLHLFKMLKEELSELQVHYTREPELTEFRKGDVRHSQADITKAQQLLGFDPQFDVKLGLKIAMPWYVNEHTKQVNLGKSE